MTWVQVKSTWRQISKWRQQHSMWSFFLRKRKAIEEGLHSLQRLSDEAANIRFTEELNFETEVAQVAALSAILLCKKPRQERGRDEFRNNNWRTQGYRNWDDAAFTKRLRVSRETFEFILAKIENDMSNNLLEWSPIPPHLPPIWQYACIDLLMGVHSWQWVPCLFFHFFEEFL